MSREVLRAKVPPPEMHDQGELINGVFRQTRKEIPQFLCLRGRRSRVLPGMDERVIGMPLREFGVPVVTDRFREGNYFFGSFRQLHISSPSRSASALGQSLLPVVRSRRGLATTRHLSS